MLVDPENESHEVAVAPTAVTPEVVTEPQLEDTTPEKFRGKSQAELISIYQNLESELGRARNEIGTNRRLVDELLNLRRAPKEESTTERQPVTPYDLAENPEQTITTVAKRVADERSAGAEQRLATIEQSMAMEQFGRKHANYQQTLLSPEFQTWALAAPYRTNLLKKAAEWDLDAGDELLSIYKDQAPAPKAATTTTDNTEAAKAAGLARSGGSGANKVVGANDGKKIYTRTELSDLYIRNPEEYDRRFESEFRQAYAEKRVK